MPNSQRAQESIQWLRFRCLNRGDQTVGTLVSVAFERQQLLACEAIKISGILYEPFIHQLLDPRIREPANVHRPARSEVHQAFELSSGAGDVRTVDRGFIRISRQWSGARRAFVRHRPDPLSVLRRGWHARNDLRNYFARPFYLHGVANSQRFGAYEIFVVQCRQLHRHSADFHRLQYRERIDCPGATDVHLDVEQLRLGDIRREFARDRPPWLAATDNAELFLQSERIDFHHTAVNTEIELAPDFVFEVVCPLLDIFERLCSLAMRRNRHTPPG